MVLGKILTVVSIEEKYKLHPSHPCSAGERPDSIDSVAAVVVGGNTELKLSTKCFLRKLSSG